MDTFSASELRESRNEWCARLVSIMEKALLSGHMAIFNESVAICNQHKEPEKYLKTFQNFLSQIHKWNSAIVDKERARICDVFGCDYLGDLITCVHIVQLKLLSAARVGTTTKTVTIETPDVNKFIHSCYICTARQMYKNVYLFEKEVSALKMQENARNKELLVRECIMATIRDTIPVRTMLKSYLEPTMEYDVEEDVREEIVMAPMTEKDNRFSANANLGIPRVAPNMQTAAPPSVISALTQPIPAPPPGAPSNAVLSTITESNAALGARPGNGTNKRMHEEIAISTTDDANATSGARAGGTNIDTSTASSTDELIVTF